MRYLFYYPATPAKGKTTMIDKMFVEEVRARTGEPASMIWGTVSMIYNMSEKTCYGIDFIYSEILAMLDDRVCWSSRQAAKLLLSDNG